MRSGSEAPKNGCFQKGTSLAICLVLLVAIMILTVTTARITLQGAKAARNERDIRIAFYAAEAALQDAEADIGNEENRKGLFFPPDAKAFLAGCGNKASGASHGLCKKGAKGSLPPWLAVDLKDTEASTARTVPYGRFTGKAFPVGGGTLPAMPPRYLIELMTPVSAKLPAEGAVEHYVYRITAIGFGMRETTHVVLQSIVRRERLPAEPLAMEEGGAVYRYRSIRLSWREIPNWHELRDASKSK